MRYFNLIILLVSLILANANSSSAQPNKKDGKRHEKFEARLEEFSKRLNLTSDQKEKVRIIMKDTRTEAKSIIQSTKSREERKPQMLDLVMRTDAKINAILDSKQQEIYRQIKIERLSKRMEKKDLDKEMRMEMDEVGLL